MDRRVYSAEKAGTVMKTTKLRGIDDKTLTAILNESHYRLGGLTGIAIRQRRQIRLLTFAVVMLYGALVAGFLMPVGWYLALGNTLGDAADTLILMRFW